MIGKKSLSNVSRCLKPAGILHINTMCGTPHPPNDRGFDPALRCIMHQGIARRYFGTAGSILKELADAGFSILRHCVIFAQHNGDEDCLLVDAQAIEQSLD